MLWVSAIRRSIYSLVETQQDNSDSASDGSAPAIASSPQSQGATSGGSLPPSPLSAPGAVPSSKASKEKDKRKEKGRDGHPESDETKDKKNGALVKEGKEREERDKQIRKQRDTQATKAGFLNRQKNNPTGWVKNWFVLSGVDLNWYKNKEAPIHLPQAKRVALAQ